MAQNLKPRPFVIVLTKKEESANLFPFCPPVPHWVMCLNLIESCRLIPYSKNCMDLLLTVPTSVTTLAISGMISLKNKN